MQFLATLGREETLALSRELRCLPLLLLRAHCFQATKLLATAPWSVLIEAFLLHPKEEELLERPVVHMARIRQEVLRQTPSCTGRRHRGLGQHHPAAAVALVAVVPAGLVLVLGPVLALVPVPVLALEPVPVPDSSPGANRGPKEVPQKVPWPALVMDRSTRRPIERPVLRRSLPGEAEVVEEVPVGKGIQGNNMMAYGPVVGPVVVAADPVVEAVVVAADQEALLVGRSMGFRTGPKGIGLVDSLPFAFPLATPKLTTLLEHDLVMADDRDRLEVAEADTEPVAVAVAVVVRAVAAAAAVVAVVMEVVVVAAAAAGPESKDCQPSEILEEYEDPAVDLAMR